MMHYPRQRGLSCATPSVWTVTTNQPATQHDERTPLSGRFTYGIWLVLGPETPR